MLEQVAIFAFAFQPTSVGHTQNLRIQRCSIQIIIHTSTAIFRYILQKYALTTRYRKY